MAPFIPRPVPIGSNKRGIPLWDGTLNAAFRIAHGVPQTEIARRLGTPTSGVIVAYEYKHRPVVQSYDRMEQYFRLVESAAALREQHAAEALEELKAAQR